MSNEIGVAPSKVLGLQKDYASKALTAFEQKDEQFFNALEAFLKANYQQKEELIEKVLGKTSVESFIVGQVFQHRNKNLVPQYHGDNFKNWLWASAQARVVSINAFGNSAPKEYVLPKNMNDTSIQNDTNSIPMDEDAFWSILYMLVINPKLGKKILKYELRKDKYYIFHVKLASGKMVAVGWFVGEWDFGADEFDSDNDWSGGDVFLYPATA